MTDPTICKGPSDAKYWWCLVFVVALCARCGVGYLRGQMCVLCALEVLHAQYAQVSSFRATCHVLIVRTTLRPAHFDTYSTFSLTPHTSAVCVTESVQSVSQSKLTRGQCEDFLPIVYPAHMPRLPSTMTNHVFNNSFFCLAGILHPRCFGIGAKKRSGGDWPATSRLSIPRHLPPPFELA